MPIPVFPPSKDADLLTWSANFDAKITATPVRYGLTAAQATAYTPLHTAYATALAAVTNPNTNSKQAVIAKNQAKENLLRAPGGAWELVDIVQAYPGTTDAFRGELGLRIKDVEPTPVPAPVNPPLLAIVSTLNRAVKLKLKDITDLERRGKPEGVDGAAIVYHVGETAPLDPTKWVFLMNTSKTTVDAELPAGVPANSSVWFTAMWFNQRKESSPPATAQQAFIGGGLSAMAA
jgi:hypothetical protein